MIFRPMKQIKRKWSEDQYDNRKAFAKIMREIEVKVDSMNINPDKNLGIPDNLAWRFDKSNKFIATFKRNMEQGFKEVKGRIGNIKTILSN